MNDIEKAIETIKRISDLDTKYHFGISNYDLLTAIEALREKSERENPKPLTLEDFEFDVIDNKTGKIPDLEHIALYEKWAKGLMYCDMDGFAITEDGTLILMDDCGRLAYCPDGRFKVALRTKPERSGK